MSTGSTTVDRKHKEILRKQEQHQSKLPELKNKLISLRNRLEKLNALDAATFLNQNGLEDRTNIIMEIEKLEQDISNLENKKETTEYFNKVGGILYSYYDEVKSKNQPAQIEQQQQPPPLLMRGSLSKKYFEELDPINNRKPVEQPRCKDCDVMLTTMIEEGIIVCDKCGFTEEVVIDTNKSSYKDPPPEASYYAYQRKNHFMEILAQFQAKETTNIPEEVFIGLRKEILKNRITNLAKLKYKHIKDYLKKLGFATYYEHIPFILFKLTGQCAPQFSAEIERKLILMFDMCQAPWDAIIAEDSKLSGSTRDNFLNYKYTLYKFIELLGLDEYKEYLYLLKNRERLIEQDRYWKQICQAIQRDHPEWAEMWVYKKSSFF